VISKDRQVAGIPARVAGAPGGRTQVAAERLLAALEEPGELGPEALDVLGDTPSDFLGVPGYIACEFLRIFRHISGEEFFDVPGSLTGKFLDVLSGLARELLDVFRGLASNFLCMAHSVFESVLGCLVSCYIFAHSVLLRRRAWPGGWARMRAVAAATDNHTPALQTMAMTSREQTGRPPDLQEVTFSGRAPHG